MSRPTLSGHILRWCWNFLTMGRRVSKLLEEVKLLRQAVADVEEDNLRLMRDFTVLQERVDDLEDSKVRTVVEWHRLH